MPNGNDELQQSELWEMARHLVSLNTVSALSNVEAAEYLASYLDDCDYNTRVLKETVEGVEKASVLAWAGPEVPGGLILSGHMDIVPFEGQPGWRYDPLKMILDGERIYGRGVSDMKVFLAQAVLAARKYPPARLKRPLVYIFTCDEELAGQGVHRLSEHIPEVFAGYPLPDVAWIGEPTGFEVFLAHKGYAMFDVVVRGKGGHSSAPRRGLNAIEKMGEVISFLREHNGTLQQQPLMENVHLFPEYPASVFNCGVINGGLAGNMIAEECRMTVSVRIAPGDSAQALMADLRAVIEEKMVPSMHAFAAGCGIEIENLVATPALRSPIEHRFNTLLCRVAGQPGGKGAPYATDGGQLQERLGIDSYICGPGLLEEAHQPNESIPLQNFLTGQQQVEQVVYEWCVEP